MADTLIIARSAAEALQAKSAEAVFMAGGTEINRLGSSVSAGTLISIRRADDLRTVTKENGTVLIGAAVTFEECVLSPDVPAWFREACLFMASRTKRNMATVGGNIALLRDDSYLLPCLIAAKAKVLYTVGGKAEECCVCRYMEKAKAGEAKDALITAIRLDPARRVLLKRYANTAMSYSRMNLAYGFDADGKNVAVGAAIKNAGLFRLKDAEAFASPAEAEAWAKSCPLEIRSDMYGSEDYKRYLLGTTIAKFMEDAGKEVLS